MLGLGGRVVLVTGAGSGIGFETARLLASLDCKIVLADRDAHALESVATHFPVMGTVVGDVVDEGDCLAMVAATVAAAGRIDGVIHAAGISDTVVPALKADIDDWQRIVDVTLRGTFLVCRAAGQFMIEQRSGSIVNMSSVNGLGGIPRRNAYGPAKAAVSMLTRNLACEWSGAGVRVNALAPAYIETPLVTRLIEDGKIDAERLIARTPAGRLGRPIDVAQAAAFLLSDWSSYITGVTLPVDGGWTAYGGPGDVATA